MLPFGSWKSTDTVAGSLSVSAHAPVCEGCPACAGTRLPVFTLVVGNSWERSVLSIRMA